VPYRPRRTARFLGYVLIAVCGVAAILWPPATVSTAAAGFLFYIWVLFLVAGGAISALGAGLDVWLGEYIGLWPVITASTIFGLSALATGRWQAVAGGCFLLAVTCWLFARWQEVAVLRREADRDVRSDR
jgi:uncharacterized membrane protein YdjX (TVP38/TMEM64 family)